MALTTGFGYDVAPSVVKAVLSSASASWDCCTASSAAICSAGMAGFLLDGALVGDVEAQALDALKMSLNDSAVTARWDKKTGSLDTARPGSTAWPQ